MATSLPTGVFLSYAISDLTSRAEIEPFLRRCSSLASAGLSILQIRQKTWDDADVIELATAARRALPASCRILVNRRFDLALAASADGVHLPADGLPVREVREAVPREFLVFASTHSEVEVANAADAGADAVTYGPIWETPSKSDFGSPVGLEALRRVTTGSLPILALGGIDSIERSEACASAGARGVAGIRLFFRSCESDLEAAQVVHRLRLVDRAKRR